MINNSLQYIASASWDSGLISQDSVLAIQTAITSLLIPVAIMVLQDNENTEPNWLFDAILNECVRPVHLTLTALMPFIVIALFWVTHPCLVIIFSLICDIIFMKNIIITFRWFSCRRQSRTSSQSFKSSVISKYIDKLNDKPNEELTTLIQLWKETWSNPNSRIIADIQPLLAIKFFETILLSSNENKPRLAITLFAAIDDDGVNLLNYCTLSHILDIAFHLIENNYDAIGSNIIRLATINLSKIGPYELIHRRADEYMKDAGASNDSRYKIARSVTAVDLELMASGKNITPCRRWVETVNSNSNNAIVQGFLVATDDRLSQLINDYRQANSSGNITSRYKIADTLDRIVQVCFPAANQRTIGDILTIAHPPMIVSSVDDKDPALSKLIKLYDGYRGKYLFSDCVVEPPLGRDEVGNNISTEKLNELFNRKMRAALEEAREQAAKLMAKANLGLNAKTIDELVKYIDDSDQPSPVQTRLRNSLLDYRRALASKKGE